MGCEFESAVSTPTESLMEVLLHLLLQTTRLRPERVRDWLKATHTARQKRRPRGVWFQAAPAPWGSWRCARPRTRRKGRPAAGTQPETTCARGPRPRGRRAAMSQPGQSASRPVLRGRHSA